MRHAVIWTLVGQVAALVAALAAHRWLGLPRFGSTPLLATGVVTAAFLGSALIAGRWARPQRGFELRSVLVPLVSRVVLALIGVGACAVVIDPDRRNELLLLVGLFYLVGLGIETAQSYRATVARGTDGSGT